MIKRIFHPIGQGAFYSERHEGGFNMVYDCGALPKSNLSNKIIKQSFVETDEIDILFISHFDSDHINQIETLKNHCSKIKVVVLPLLESRTKSLLANIYNAIDGTITPLIIDPNAFFDDETKIVFVKPAENENINTETIIDIESLTNNQEIESGVKIIGNNSWHFIPFNYEFSNRHIELVDLLNAESIDMEKLIDDIDYALSITRKLRVVYNKVKGKINQNSMFLYSGPNSEGHNLESRTFSQCTCSSFWHYAHFSAKIGCIYTGDGDLNVVDIKKAYAQQWDLVGTIQIPHHGDIKSYNSKTFESGNFLCPISVGSNNSYGHPSNLIIADMVGHGNTVACITEKMESLCFQTIN